MNKSRTPSLSKVSHATTKALWTRLGLMAGTFLFGVLMVVVHDTINRHFEGRFVESANQQKWLGRIGTGLAFLVKKLFSTAIGIACVQMLWWTIRNRPISMKTIDSSFSIVNSPLSIRNTRLFTETPLILLIAVFSWLLPFATIVGPSTLTVSQTQQPDTNTLRVAVPSIDYKTKFNSIGSKATYTISPAYWLTTMALQVSLGSAWIPFSPPGSVQNGSYTMEFLGPSLQCEQASQSWYQEASAVSGGNGMAPYYAAWFPYNGSSFISPAAFLEESDETSANIYPGADEKSQPSSQIFLTTWTWNYTMSTDLTNITMYNCSLWNTSYTVDFTFISQVGSYSIREKSILNPVDFQDISNATSEETAGQAWAYMCMMDALGHILYGTISDSEYGLSEGYGTQILYTPLITTKDFAQTLHNRTELPQGGVSLGNMSLGAAVEELMTNMTLSLFSVAQVLSDSQVSISNTTLRNIYAYSRLELWLGYGSGAIITFIIVVIGVWCLHQNQAAYSNSFSTVLRVTINSKLGYVISPEESSGADPIAPSLEDIKVELQELSREKDGEESRYAMTAILPEVAVYTKIEDEELKSSPIQSNKLDIAQEAGIPLLP